MHRLRKLALLKAITSLNFKHKLLNVRVNPICINVTVLKTVISCLENLCLFVWSSSSFLRDEEICRLT